MVFRQCSVCGETRECTIVNDKKICVECARDMIPKTIEETVTIKPTNIDPYVANAVEQRTEFNDEIKPKKKRFFNR